MNSEQQKQRAIEFLNQLEHPDPDKLAAMMTDNFEYELMARMPGVPTRFNKEETLRDFVGMLKTMATNGFNFRFDTPICEGPDVAVQGESRTVIANGKPYNNRYFFYLRFEGDKIACLREYCDTNHVREVFMS